MCSTMEIYYNFLIRSASKRKAVRLAQSKRPRGVNNQTLRATVEVLHVVCEGGHSVGPVPHPKTGFEGS